MLFRSFATSLDMSKIETATLPGAPNKRGYISYWILDPEQCSEVINRMIYGKKHVLQEGEELPVAGKDELVELVAASLTAPGICREGGAMFNQSRLMFQGLFMAPSIVAEAVKGAILASQVFEDIGFTSTPKPHDIRTDLIQTVEFGKKEPLLEFCKTIQECSPIESYLTPVPDVVPGYDDDLIMAGGTFVEGSTIELSADGPVRPPYAAYMQGGLNYAHVKITVTRTVDKLADL